MQRQSQLFEQVDGRYW